MTIFDTVHDLFAQLEREALTVKVTGMVKREDGRILFSPFSCDDWIEINEAIIKGIDYLGMRPCVAKDEPAHSHPFVVLTLETGDNPWMRLAATLLTRSAQQALVSSGGQIRVNEDCTYGYGACGGLNQQTGQFCPPGTRPCNAEDYTYCKPFPECNAAFGSARPLNRNMFGIPVGGPAGNCTSAWFDGQCYYGRNDCGRKVNLHLGIYSVLLNPGETHRFTTFGGGCFNSFPGTVTADFA